MSVKSVQVAVHQLCIGMYVSALDRPWCQTPFPIQGFYIRSEDDIKSLASFCKHVMIDKSLDKSAYDFSLCDTEDTSSVRVTHRERSTASKDSRVLKLQPIRVKDPVVYENQTSIKKEVGIAEKVLAKVQKSIKIVLDRAANENVLDVNTLSKASEAMVDSVVRNPDALIWLHRVQKTDEHSYHHSINAAVWALVFGRHLGLGKEVLKNLSTGVLLSSIGKTQLNPHLLGANSLSNDEFDDYKTFVTKGVEILEASGGVSHQVISIVKYHKERHNGTGYPQGVAGDKIPLLAKIAGLVDAYQSMIEPRMGAEPMTPSQAVSHLYELRNIEFQEDLVEQFIQAIGVYPTGSIVELTTKEVGLVVSHNPKRRLWPTVMVILDEEKQPLNKGKVVDLLTYNESRKEMETVHITGSLPYGAHEVDPSLYQVTGATTKWSVKHLMG